MLADCVCVRAISRIWRCRHLQHRRWAGTSTSKEEGVTVALENGAVSLLERCAKQMEGGGLSEAELRRLESWCSQACERSRSTEDFLSAAPAEWESLILAHPAHHHAWYGFIKEEATTDEMAQFLLENRHYPTFLRLLEAIEAVQICEDGRRAVQENLADEQEPVPHAGLMRRLMSCRISPACGTGSCSSARFSCTARRPSSQICTASIASSRRR